MNPGQVEKVGLTWLVASGWRKGKAGGLSGRFSYVGRDCLTKARFGEVHYSYHVLARSLAGRVDGRLIVIAINYSILFDATRS